MRSSGKARPFLYGGLTLAVIGAAAGWWFRLADRPEPAGKPVGFVAVSTTEVAGKDMSTSESLPGRLGFGAVRPVLGARDGIVTWLPRPGATLGRGDQVYRADDQAVPLFFGGMPLYRTLSEPGTVGRDVRIIANNLRALGYSIGRQPAKVAVPAVSPSAPAPPPVVVGRGESVYTPALIDAVKRWQRAERLPVTGRIGAADVVVLPGAVRVGSVSVQLGAAASGPLLQVSTTAKVITVAAESGQAAAIEAGDRVTITMPDDRTVPGQVSAVGPTTPPPGSDEPPGFTVAITVDDPKAIAKLSSADVQVEFVAETHRDVLAVPVDALLALAEGGYALQAEDGRLLAVKTGIYAKGYVEISGSGVTAGLRVVTTS